MALSQSAPRHWQFAFQAVGAVDVGWKQEGGKMAIFHGDADQVFERLAAQYQVVGIYAHQETGLEWTFRRDQRVMAWARSLGIRFHEYRQDGVRRKRWNRIGWEDDWEADMSLPQQHPDLSAAVWAPLPESTDQLPAWIRQFPEGMQPGEFGFANRYLRSFLNERVDGYYQHISKPALARRSCSRLSPYLAHGALSTRQVFQVSRFSQSEPHRQRNLHQFLSRIWWRSHFMQKLESDYGIEHRPFNPGFEGQLNRGKRLDWLEAWQTGQTGFPMIDASMRSLQATGFLNFRMRAMLVSFATFPLWLDWQSVSDHLAKMFLDFEPGIHICQVQMQAGMSGYHTLRVYNPTYQIQKNDPQGAFVKHWVPELASVPDPMWYEPWKMTEMEQTFYNCRIGVDYPAPLVDFKEAARTAKDRYWEVRKSDAVQAEIQRLLHLHCSPSKKQLQRDAAQEQE